MSSLFNLDLLAVGITVSAITILGFMAIYTDRKSITNQSFLIFCLLTAVWGVSNYFNNQTDSPVSALWILRLHLFISVFHSLSFFRLAYVIPKEKIIFPKFYKFGILPLTWLTALLTLTPLVFSKISKIPGPGEVANPERGPAIILFALVAFGLILLGTLILFIKTIKTQAVEKKQLRLISLGALLTFILIILFNLVFPVFLNQVQFIPFGAVFIFPFIVFCAYAIFRHKLLNIKVISTEILIFALALATLLQIIASTSLATLLLRVSIFLLVLGVGILLIRSVIHEVQQREQLEILSKELAEANEKLKALDQARADFISIASHQLRTPPATVKWYMSSLLSGDYGKIPPGIEEKLKKVRQTNDHLISLIEDMLNVSRIERGKMEFLFAMTDIGELAQYAFDQLVPMAQDKKLKYTYKPPAKKLPLIMADHEKLRQVMNNLIDNSLKYTKEGSVDVQLLQKGGDIIFQVKDSGKGISPEEKNTIFEKFSRGKESVKQSAGLGLGLYVAKIIIEQHKGKLWAESPGNGKGSIFSFSIPINNGLKETTLVDLVAPK